jgi:hypothetical protein
MTNKQYEDYDFIYFLHIPKTGGTFLMETIIKPTFDQLDMPKKFFFEGHWSWNEHVDNNNRMYVVSMFRDPAIRTVSYFVHTVKQKHSFLQTTPQNNDFSKENFLSWFEKNKKGLADFQSKTLIHYKQKEYGMLKDPEFINMKADREKIFSHIKRLNLFLKNPGNFTLNDVQKIENKIIRDITKNDYIKTSSSTRISENTESSELLNQLSDQELKMLYDNNPLDCEIFFDDSYFFDINSYQLR